jgi:hypothetical protein
MIEIPYLSAHLMILDVLADGYRYRLAGSDIGNRLGTELTGMTVGRTTEAESKWHDLLDVVQHQQKPLVVTSEMPAPLAGKRMGVLLPLLDRSGKTEQILAGIFFGRDFRPGMSVGKLAVQDLMTDRDAASKTG